MIQGYRKVIKNYFSIVNIKQSYKVGMILSAIIQHSADLLAVFFAARIIKYATEKNLQMTYLSLGLLVLSYVILFITQVINKKLYAKITYHCFSGVQRKVLEKTMIADEKSIDSISKGKIISTMNHDVIEFGDVYDQMISIAVALVKAMVILIIVFFVNWLYGLLLILYCFAYLLLKESADQKSVFYLNKQRKEMDKYTSLYSEVIPGLQEIKTFNMVEPLREKLDIIDKKNAKLYFLKRKYALIKEEATQTLSRFYKIFLYIIAVFLLGSKWLSVDLMILVIGYFDRITNSLDWYLESSSLLREYGVMIERIKSILNIKTEVISFGDYHEDNIKGKVEFQNVSFTYDKNPTLRNINFTIKPNAITAIVGRSGSGKTSIINLLLRLYKIEKGTILIDGINIYDYSKEVYYSNVAVVNQKPFVFNMSIRQNLDFVDRNIEHQMEACKRVGIHDFIMSLPKGYDTILRENATNISGGQKQLISLARTLLSKSEILLFDEITSSLDPDTAEQISSLLNNLKKDRTIIMITHKPNLMKKADHIIVIDEGKVVATGNHKQLIEKSSHYKWLQARKSASKLGVFDYD